MIQLEKDWHTYWLNPGDSGAAVFFKWSLPQGWKVGEIHMPPPLRIPTPPLETFGYEGEVLFYSELLPPKGFEAATAKIELEAEWLVCKDVCIPAVHTFVFTLPQAKGEAEKSKDFEKFELAEAKVPLASQEIEGQVKVTGKRAELQLKAPPEWSIIDIFPGPDHLISNKALTLASSKKGQWNLHTSLSIKKEKAKNRDILVEYKTPDSPDSQFTWVTLHEDKPALLLLVGFAFLGGLLLNLMPCVFPLISIKFFSVLKHSQGNLRIVQRDNSFYVLGVIVSFWALAFLLFVLRASGEALGWGFQLQSPGFVIGLILLFSLMAFNFLGWLEIQLLLPGTNKWLQKDGPMGHFLTGVLSTIVASPCTAPFMGVSIGFALAQPLPLMLLIFTSLGLGLSFPYIFLSLFPSLTLYLPKPGLWMEKLKTFMAFPLFATMIWLAWSLSFQISSTSLAWVWCSVLLLGFFVWMTKNLFQKSKLKLRLAQIIVLISAVAVAFGSIQPLTATPSMQDAELGLQWEKFSPARLSQLRAEKTAVFIDFTAAWCITCQVNKKVTFSDTSLAQLIKDANIALLRADWTNRDPQITQVLQEYGRAGVPLYLFFPASGAPAVVLPEILTASIFRKHIEPHLSSLNSK